MKYIGLLVFFLFSISNAKSQQVGIDGLVGYSAFVVPSKGEYINGIQISLLSTFHPKQPFFSVSTGISYQVEDEWNFLKVPVKLKLNFGRKVSFLIGGGCSANYIMLPSAYYEKYGVLSKSDFTFNGILFLGIGVNIAKNWKIMLIPEYEGSFTPLYKSFGGHHGYDNEKYNSFTINLGVSYIFKNIKK